MSEYSILPYSRVRAKNKLSSDCAIDDAVQNVNAYHRGLRRWLGRFCGVACAICTIILVGIACSTANRAGNVRCMPISIGVLVLEISTFAIRESSYVEPNRPIRANIE
jgi:hypothetical protein